MTTHLYIKRHVETGMMYFGKTSKKDPYAYNGSGVLWKRHIKKHGDNIQTIWVKEFDLELVLNVGHTRRNELYKY